MSQEVDQPRMACDITHGQTDPESGGDLHQNARHHFTQWYEDEVRSELRHINQKLDRILHLGSTTSSQATYPVAHSPTHGPHNPTGSKLIEILTSKCSSRRASRISFRSRQSVNSRLSLANSNSIFSSSGFFDVNPIHVCPEEEGTGSEPITPSGPANVNVRGSYRSTGGHVSDRMTKFEADVAAAKIMERKRWFSFLDEVWRALEDPESSVFARWFARLMPAFIIATVCVTLLQSVESPPLRDVPAAVIETTIDVIFLLEVLVRFVACPNRADFFLSWYNVIDLVAVAPLAVRVSIGFVIPTSQVETVPQAILLCSVPIVRILKMLRRFEQFHLLLQAFKLAAEALPVLMFMLSVITIIFAVLIYLVEPRDNIVSLAHAIWFTIVTMTTVGYGDVIPKSVTGSTITGVLVVITLLYMAVPLGIIGNAFTQTWLDRDRILLTQRTRDRLRQWGFSAYDIPILFQSGKVDSSGSGALNIDEFRELIKRMQLGFNDERIYQLFRSFDINGSGSIDDKEFVRTLFPNNFHTIFASDKWVKSEASA